LRATARLHRGYRFRQRQVLPRTSLLILPSINRWRTLPRCRTIYRFGARCGRISRINRDPTRLPIIALTSPQSPTRCKSRIRSRCIVACGCEVVLTFGRRDEIDDFAGYAP